ncbi:hypothetical protein GYMLUDRAFT_59406 [Collybiopsis luxurians FD-317 M1]|uniref:Integrase core domain-containing protein n=1 Tax=Collybiopsis luxurians FD-317 M1 TaxID=944289 RepID=A0A0D0CX01_9AGAR|nr:hypothetical protein GYMLUDRAFT_59406 [Collybiopsis luxurians FD-317 M1]
MTLWRSWSGEHMGSHIHGICLGRRLRFLYLGKHLWVDVSNYISQAWNNLFTSLELHHGLQISNVNHVWLLQHLFLPVINEQLAFWAESWNHHWITQQDSPAWSPEDRFGFDMLINGHWGDPVDWYAMTNEKLEVFGVDWEGLQDDDLLQSLWKNYSNEGAGSWLGHNGPLSDLNEVSVNTPTGPLTQQQVDYLDTLLQAYSRQPSHKSLD